MKAKERALAAELLDAAADEFMNHGCNDWEFPTDWTESECADFARRFHEWNGDPEGFNPERLDLPDYAVMLFLAALLRAEGQEG